MIFLYEVTQKMKYRFVYIILLMVIGNLHGKEDNSTQPEKFTEKKNNTISLSRKDLCILFNIVIHFCVFIFLSEFGYRFQGNVFNHKWMFRMLWIASVKIFAKLLMIMLI